MSLLVAGGLAHAENVLVDFKALGTQTTPQLSLGVMDITADDGTNPADVFMLNLNGLGVIGGIDSQTDGDETLHFRFDAPVHDVRYGVFVASNLDGDGFVGEAFVEAFVGSTSLGVVATNDTGWHDVTQMFGGAVITGFDVHADVDGQRIDQLLYRTSWDDVGNALAGTHGDPFLEAQGTLLGGGTLSLSLTNALEGTPAFLVLGTTAVNQPLLGGTLVPQAELVLPLATNGVGEFALDATWPAGFPAGTSLFFQFWIVDPAGPSGFSASNAMRGIVP